MFYFCIVKLLYKRCLIKIYCIMNRSDFIEKCNILKFNLSSLPGISFRIAQGRNYCFLLITSSDTLFASCSLSEMLNVFPIESDDWFYIVSPDGIRIHLNYK